MDGKIDNSPKKDGYPLIPDQSIKCVWMTAGLISYKLCKYDLQCEKCPLDWELRNLSSAPSFDSTAPPEIKHLKTGEKLTPPPPERDAEEEEGAREDLRRLKIKEDLFYHYRHTWIKVEKGDEVRIGIDRFLGGLIGKATAVILPLSGGRSNQGESLCSIIQEEGMLHIVSPISGLILSVNQRLKDRPSLLNRDSEGDGFLMTLTPKHLQRDQQNFFSGEGALSWCRKEWERFKTEVISELPIRQKWLGMTMQDGEVTLRDIKQLIGPQRYIRLVNNFLRRGEKFSPDTKA
ncbi:MAG: glycine cleavage system protein H [Deltaproteobacteria bacterium]|nr:glycine cleavage system protein H [Deltaproteobacteria bacterium]